MSPEPPRDSRRLGRPFGTLWTAAAVSNLADGVGRTAVPLAATTLTTDPIVISLFGAVAFLPWLVFGLPAGMVVDRFDRRVAMAAANALRGAAPSLCRQPILSVPRRAGSRARCVGDRAQPNSSSSSLRTMA